MSTHDELANIVARLDLDLEGKVEALENWLSLHDAEVTKLVKEALTPTWKDQRQRIAEFIKANPRSAAAWEVKTGGINRATDLAMMHCFAPDLRHWKGDDQVLKALDVLAEAYHEALTKMTERLNW